MGHVCVLNILVTNTTHSTNGASYKCACLVVQIVFIDKTYLTTN